MGRYITTPTMIWCYKSTRRPDMVAIIDPLTRTYWLRKIELKDCLDILWPIRSWNIEEGPLDDGPDMFTLDMLCRANNRDVTEKYSLEDYVKFVKRKHVLFREKNKKKGAK